MSLANGARDAKVLNRRHSSVTRVFTVSGLGTADTHMVHDTTEPYIPQKTKGLKSPSLSRRCWAPVQVLPGQLSEWSDLSPEGHGFLG